VALGQWKLNSQLAHLSIPLAARVQIKRIGNIGIQVAGDQLLRRDINPEFSASSSGYDGT
jgi:hypothetical protein